MKRYEPPKPGVAFALAAAGLAVMTMIAFVMLPAELESFGQFGRRAAAPALAVPVTSIAGDGGTAPASESDGGNVRQS